MNDVLEKMKQAARERIDAENKAADAKRRAENEADLVIVKKLVAEKMTGDFHAIVKAAGDPKWFQTGSEGCCRAIYCIPGYAPLLVHIESRWQTVRPAGYEFSAKGTLVPTHDHYGKRESALGFVTADRSLGDSLIAAEKYYNHMLATVESREMRLEPNTAADVRWFAEQLWLVSGKAARRRVTLVVEMVANGDSAIYSRIRKATEAANAKLVEMKFEQL